MTFQKHSPAADHFAQLANRRARRLSETTRFPNTVEREAESVLTRQCGSADGTGGAAKLFEVRRDPVNGFLDCRILLLTGETAPHLGSHVLSSPTELVRRPCVLDAISQGPESILPAISREA